MSSFNNNSRDAITCGVIWIACLAMLIAIELVSGLNTFVFASFPLIFFMDLAIWLVYSLFAFAVRIRGVGMLSVLAVQMAWLPNASCRYHSHSRNHHHSAFGALALGNSQGDILKAESAEHFPEQTGGLPCFATQSNSKI